ncbi:MAG TPA: hypothetical protein VFH78_03415 [Candidatus Thermoplasmatota archaeon]|nr:hypothetical protein [Candidatus Thermoplasmatota archaeon]
MPRFICPQCESALDDAPRFAAHMESEHPERRAAVGFGHTL